MVHFEIDVGILITIILYLVELNNIVRPTYPSMSNV